MDTQPIWETLSGISIGTIIAWIIVICAIVAAICTGTIKLYKIFEKYRGIKDKSVKQSEIIEQHEKILNQINNSLKEISLSLDEQKEVNLKQIRHTIVHTCEDALEKGTISISKLKSLEEMYEEYVEVFHGNGYVKTLVSKTRELPVVSIVDE